MNSSLEYPFIKFCVKQNNKTSVSWIYPFLNLKFKESSKQIMCVLQVSFIKNDLVGVFFNYQNLSGTQQQFLVLNKGTSEKNLQDVYKKNIWIGLWSSYWELWSRLKFHTFLGWNIIAIANAPHWLHGLFI